MPTPHPPPQAPPPPNLNSGETCNSCNSCNSCIELLLPFSLHLPPSRPTAVRPASPALALWPSAPIPHAEVSHALSHQSKPRTSSAAHTAPAVPRSSKRDANLPNTARLHTPRPASGLITASASAAQRRCSLYNLHMCVDFWQGFENHDDQHTALLPPASSTQHNSAHDYHD